MSPTSPKQSQQSTIIDVYINISRISSLQKSWKITAFTQRHRRHKCFQRITNRWRNAKRGIQPSSHKSDVFEHINKPYNFQPGTTSQERFKRQNILPLPKYHNFSSTRQSTSSSLFQPRKPVAAIALTSHDRDAVGHKEHENNRPTRHIWTRYRQRVLTYFNDCDHSSLAVNMFSALK